MLIAVYEEPLLEGVVPGEALGSSSSRMCSCGGHFSASFAASTVALGRKAHELLGQLECPVAIAARDFAGSIGLAAQVETSCADPAHALSAFGADLDLLLIGSSRRGPASRVCLGTTGKAFAARAPCAVLIAPRLAAAPST
jgi:Universal stress protein family